MKYTQAVQLQQAGTLTKKTGTNTWTVATEFVWFLDYSEKTRNYIIVEEGFETNFGSVPRCFWFLYNPTKYTAYMLHDRLYRGDKKIFDEKLGRYRPLTRKEADMILIEALEVEGMGRVGRFFVYVGLRAFGWYAWNNS